MMKEEQLSDFMQALGIYAHDQNMSHHHSAAQMLGNRYLIHLEQLANEEPLTHHSYLVTTLKYFIGKLEIENIPMIMEDLNNEDREVRQLIEEDPKIIERLRTIFHSHDAAEPQILPRARTHSARFSFFYPTPEAEVNYVTYLLQEIKHGHAIRDALEKLAHWPADGFLEASDALIAQNGLEILLKCITSSTEIEIRRFALLAICKHVVRRSFGLTHNREHTRQLLAQALKLILDADILTVETAFSILLHMIKINDEMINEEHVIQPCLHLLNKVTDPAIQQINLDFIIAITESNASYRQLIYQMNGITILQRYILQHKEHKALAIHALKALGNLAIDDPTIQNAMWETGMLSILIRWLKRENDDELKCAILRALSLICRSNNKHQEQLLLQGCIIDLMMILTHSTNHDLIQRAANLLAWATLKHAGIQKVLDNPQYIPVIIRLLSDNNEKTQKYALWIISELVDLLIDKNYSLPLKRFSEWLNECENPAVINSLIYILAVASSSEMYAEFLNPSMEIFERFTHSSHSQIKTQALWALNSLTLVRAKQETLLQQYETALNLYDTILQRDPEQTVALYERACLYEQLQHYDLALQDYQRLRRMACDPEMAQQVQEAIQRIENHAVESYQCHP